MIREQLIPKEMGFTMHVDEYAQRWRFEAFSTSLPSIGFGVRSGRAKRQALEQALDAIWDASGMARPEAAFVGSVAPEL